MRQASLRTAFIVAVSLVVRAPIAQAQVRPWNTMLPLPRPSGSYAVGTFVTRFVDTAALSPRKGIPRPIIAQAWYPAVARTGAGQAPYLPEPLLLDSMIAYKYFNEPESEMRAWRDVRLAARVQATPREPPTASGWPVVIFSHGFGVSRVHYASIVQELASKGYVVIALDHPNGGYMLAPNGAALETGRDSLRSLRAQRRAESLDDGFEAALAWIVKTWSHEGPAAVRHVATLPRSAAGGVHLRLDTTRVAFAGHSLGGAAALQACHDEQIVKVCADLDGRPVGDVMTVGVGKPFLALLNQPAGPTAPPSDSAEASRQAQAARFAAQRDSMWTAILARYPDVPSFIVKIEGTGHFTFSDAPFQLPARLQNVGATLSPQEMHDVVLRYLLEFLDYALRDRPLNLKRGMTFRPASPAR